VIAASLKRILFDGQQLGPLRFRDHVIAGSLKRGVSESVRGARSGFPRSRDRGLIEAISARPSGSASRKFPRSRDRGLIEANMRSGTVARVIPLFPRSRDRGLIEATIPRSLWQQAWRFRDHVIAASLKPQVPVLSLPEAIRFRDHVIAASLKHRPDLERFP